MKTNEVNLNDWRDISVYLRQTAESIKKRHLFDFPKQMFYLAHNLLNTAKNNDQKLNIYRALTTVFGLTIK